MKNAEDLRQDVIDEMTWDRSLDTPGIGVAVHDNAVTLTGHVRSYAEKRAAEKAAKRVHGVVAVANDLEVRLPNSLQRDDTDIAAATATALKWSAPVPGTVSATVERGWVILDGEVDWAFQRRSAENAVRDLAGVRGVSNQIRVKPRAVPKDVVDRIKRAFNRSAQIDADHISVAVSGGKVTLSGSVRSWSERTEAEHAARAAAGVTDVENKLHVSSMSTVLMP
ncbi:MAG: BON domain-containing protein [Gemmatimonadota bacterium]